MTSYHIIHKHIHHHSHNNFHDHNHNFNPTLDFFVKLKSIPNLIPNSFRKLNSHQHPTKREGPKYLGTGYTGICMGRCVRGSESGQRWKTWPFFEVHSKTMPQNMKQIEYHTNDQMYSKWGKANKEHILLMICITTCNINWKVEQVVWFNRKR